MQFVNRTPFPETNQWNQEYEHDFIYVILFEPRRHMYIGDKRAWWELRHNMHSNDIVVELTQNQLSM